MGPAGMRMRNKDDTLYSDAIDNRQCVHDLCASERESSHDVFVTLTCDQREHFGIKNVKRCIDDGEALQNYKRHLADEFPTCEQLTARTELEVQRSSQEASMTLTVRNWMEVRKTLIECLLRSPELPLGSEVEKNFVRDECQGDAGNLSHLHMLVAMKKSAVQQKGKPQSNQQFGVSLMTL